MLSIPFTVTQLPAHAGSLAPSTPLNDEGFFFAYPANEKVSHFLSDYLHKIAEADIISHELVGRFFASPCSSRQQPGLVQLLDQPVEL